MTSPGDIKGRQRKVPSYKDIDGFRVPSQFSSDAVRASSAYKARPDDLFVVTFPRCGTTWVQNIVASILRGGQPFSSFMEFLLQTPYMDLVGVKAAEDMKRPGAIKLHRPFHLAPWSPEAKYIFVTRNPKDCCVSFYNITKNIPGYAFEDGEFDDYFELFINGKIDFGDYFDYLISWYEHRNDPNVLFIVYEQIKKDTANHIFKIAEFLGPQYKERLEKDKKLFQDVMYYSSFDFLQKFCNESFDEILSLPEELAQNNPDIPTVFRPTITANRDRNTMPKMNFVRKGIVGDWRNYFSAEQSARMDKKFKERTAGIEIPDLWEEAMKY